MRRTRAMRTGIAMDVISKEEEEEKEEEETGKRFDRLFIRRQAGKE